MAQALAIKYRPKNFSDVVEQGSTIAILTNQINTASVKSAYLFCGGAGTGKTTSARIFASMINKGSGEPIELDAASNNSVEDIRRITEEAQTKSLDSEYKVFILDEVHSLSNQAWQAMLKTLEEPPAKSIFILCTTNPEKIPATILSRVQRYNFQRISMDGVVNRLLHILEQEELESGISDIDWDINAIHLIAKIADGGMRDAITLMDKCLSYTPQLTVENVIEALGIADYSTMLDLTNAIISKDKVGIINIINDVYSSGIDLKQFVKNYFEYILDLCIYNKTNNESMIKTPKDWLPSDYTESKFEIVNKLLEYVTNIMNEIKWIQNPKSVVLARFLLFSGDN